MCNEHRLITELRELYRRLDNLERITFKDNPAGLKHASEHLCNQITLKKNQCRQVGIDPTDYI